jgi:hypothetical protein
MALEKTARLSGGREGGKAWSSSDIRDRRSILLGEKPHRGTP